MRIQDVIPPLRLDRARHAAPQVFDTLRELIVGLALPPGTVLPRNELAERFGLSQTPIRDALMRLEEEGLVDVFPQHATLVSRISLASARQAHFLRRSLELEVVYLLASAPDADLLARLQGHIDQQARELAREDFSAFVAADRAFHHAMHVAAGVESLWQLQQRTSGHVDRLRRLHVPEAGKAQRILKDHQAVLAAIAAGDPAAAQARLREHLSGTLAQVEEISLRYPDYVIQD